MSIFSKSQNQPDKEAVLFSPLEGRLTYDNRPASGAKLTLWVAWKDQQGESEHYIADSDGYFKIPEKKTKYKASPFSQLSIGQSITVEYNDQEFLIWKAGKSNGHLFGELGGQPVGLTCELTERELDAYLDHALLETSCKWKRLEEKEF